MHHRALHQMSGCNRRCAICYHPRPVSTKKLLPNRRFPLLASNQKQENKGNPHNPRPMEKHPQTKRGTWNDDGLQPWSLPGGFQVIFETELQIPLLFVSWGWNARTVANLLPIDIDPNFINRPCASPGRQAGVRPVKSIPLKISRKKHISVQGLISIHIWEETLRQSTWFAIIEAFAVYQDSATSIIESWVCSKLWTTANKCSYPAAQLWNSSNLWRPFCSAGKIPQ